MLIQSKLNRSWRTSRKCYRYNNKIITINGNTTHDNNNLKKLKLVKAIQ